MYRREFRLAVIHSGLMILSPKQAYEQSGNAWQNVFDAVAFRNEYFTALDDFQKAGKIGKDLQLQIRKIGIRIDKNKDGILSDSEILDYATQKLNIIRFAQL